MKMRLIMAEDAVRMVRCPSCSKPAAYSKENEFRPFCSERCRILDLGTWASEGYKIPTEESVLTDPDNYSDDEKIN
jgi:hypothetical protein